VSLCKNKMNDICVFSIVLHKDIARTKINILNGTVRTNLVHALQIHCGLSGAMIADSLGRTYLRRISPFLGHDTLLPQLLYSRWMLGYCSLREKSRRFGIGRAKQCVVCGERTAWGLDDDGCAICIMCHSNEWMVGVGRY
jgi:hypothetical protein